MSVTSLVAAVSAPLLFVPLTPLQVPRDDIAGFALTRPGVLLRLDPSLHAGVELATLPGPYPHHCPSRSSVNTAAPTVLELQAAPVGSRKSGFRRDALPPHGTDAALMLGPAEPIRHLPWAAAAKRPDRKGADV